LLLNICLISTDLVHRKVRPVYMRVYGHTSNIRGRRGRFKATTEAELCCRKWGGEEKGQDEQHLIPWAGCWRPILRLLVIRIVAPDQDKFPCFTSAEVPERHSVFTMKKSHVYTGLVGLCPPNCYLDPRPICFGLSLASLRRVRFLARRLAPLEMRIGPMAG